jgi:hypothetical protein
MLHFALHAHNQDRTTNDNDNELTELTNHRLC